jgi:hypothetical protein
MIALKGGFSSNRAICFADILPYAIFGNDRPSNPVKDKGCGN